MTRSTKVVSMTGAMLLCFQASIATASFHEWQIKEVYSNASGSHQFIELFTESDNQQFAVGQQITSGLSTFVFPGFTPSPTGGHHLLIATPGFGSLAGGVTPDFTLPTSPFFSPTADTINFIGVDSFSFTAGMLPTDGINSLVDTPLGSSNFDSGINSPTNFAGEVGFVPEPSTLILATIGALGVLGLRRRRTRRN